MNNFKVEINYHTTELVNSDDTTKNVSVEKIERLCLIPPTEFKDPDEQFYLLTIEEARDLGKRLITASIKAKVHNTLIESETTQTP